ncbi:MAG: glycogen synthase GlgA [Armatimonadetes bacterium]|nr:glycogen synthase GlgA [Armatimonadota bacterium]
MKVFFAAVEAVPFAKVGGLADVAGTLPLALTEIGVEASLVMPLHRQCLDHGPFGLKIQSLPVTLGPRTYEASVYEGRLEGPGVSVPVYFVRYDPFYDRNGVYDERNDAAQRYAFFAKAVVTLADAVGGVDVLHANDYHTALLAVYARLRENPIPTIYTIHNLAYQGVFPMAVGPELGLETEEAIAAVAHNGAINFMAAGIRNATIVTTVSEKYAQEIQTPEFGEGLQDLLAARAAEGALFGVLNGIDPDMWNPATDDAIPAKYSSQDLAPKTVCKLQLQRELGLEVDACRPLAGCIARLASQKGLDILAEAVPDMVAMGFQLALLGTGEAELEQRFRHLAEAYPGRVAAAIRFDADLARRIYAGSDMFLIPSRYEPCGLTQMISMAYGTIPIARWTGGLADTIVEWAEGKIDAEPAPDQNGFLFGKPDKHELLGALGRALAAYHDRDRWKSLILNAMSRDFSWKRSAQRYRQLYEQAVKLQGGQR